MIPVYSSGKLGGGGRLGGREEAGRYALKKGSSSARHSNGL